MTVAGQFLKAASYVTVEPVIFLFFWTLPYIDHANAVLLFSRFCLESYNQTVCDNIQHDKHNEANVVIQGYSSRWIMYSKVAMVVPMLYSTTILGAISDKFHRKLPMVVPAIGVILGCIWLLILSVMPLLDVRLLLVATFIFGCTGYFGAGLMATSAYLGSLTTASTRTWRISVYEAALQSGLVLGSLTSGLIIDNKHLGLPAVYGLVAVIHLIAVIYTIARIVEQHTVKSETPIWSQLCRFSYVSDYVRTIYKPRAQSRRLYLHLIFAAFMTSGCSNTGLYDVLFLYLTKSRDFTNSLFSLFTGTQAILATIGNIVIMWTLRQKLRLTEPWIIIVSATGGMLSYSMIAFSEVIVIWLSLIFVGTTGLTGGAARGFISKLVPESEQGQVFAFVAMGQCMVTLLASVIFNNIYPPSLRFWDGFCVLLAALMMLFAIGLSAFVIYHRKRHGLDDETLEMIESSSSSTMSYDARSETLSDMDSKKSLSEDEIDPEDIEYESKIRLPAGTGTRYGSLPE